ncbi:unnamed protein product [Brassica oleracea var. botrytis]
MDIFLNPRPKVFKRPRRSHNYNPLNQNNTNRLTHNKEPSRTKQDSNLKEGKNRKNKPNTAPQRRQLQSTSFKRNKPEKKLNLAKGGKRNKNITIPDETSKSTTRI